MEQLTIRTVSVRCRRIVRATVGGSILAGKQGHGVFVGHGLIFSQVRVRVKLLFLYCHRSVSVYRHPKVLTLKELRVGIKKLNVRSILRDRITARLHFLLDNPASFLVVPARLHAHRKPQPVQPHHPCLHRFVVVHAHNIRLFPATCKLPVFGCHIRVTVNFG